MLELAQPQSDAPANTEMLKVGEGCEKIGQVRLDNPGEFVLIDDDVTEEQSLEVPQPVASLHEGFHNRCGAFSAVLHAPAGADHERLYQAHSGIGQKRLQSGHGAVRVIILSIDAVGGCGELLAMLAEVIG